jgi:hypothetical protein
MLKKILRWCAVLIGLVVLLLVGGVLAFDWYLASEEDKRLHDIFPTGGMDVTFRKADYRFWSTFPRLTIELDSFVLRDTLHHRDQPPLLQAGRLTAEVSLGAYLRDTLEFRELSLHEGSIHILADSTDQYNFGSFGPDSTANPAPASSALQFKWEGMNVDIRAVDFTYIRPARDKRMIVRIDSLRATGTRGPANSVNLNAALDLHVHELIFNTAKGSYLRDTPLAGPVTVSAYPDSVVVERTELAIGPQTFSVAALFDRREGSNSHIYLANDRTDFGLARAMLHDDLQEKLSQYDVSGPFPVRADIETNMEPGENTKVTVDFALEDQDIKLQRHRFSGVSGHGRVVNRLPEAEGGIPGSRKNLRIVAYDISGYLGGIRMEADSAIVRDFETDTRLETSLVATGPAAAVSEQLGATDFFFTGGTFRLENELEASLMSQTAMLDASQARLVMRDVGVRYEPAGATFPFERIELGKRGDDIRFRVRSDRLPSDFSFDLEGEIDNLTPLLLDVPGERVNADVRLTAPRIDWTDLLTFFGQDGYFAEEEETQPAADTLTAVQQRRALRQTLLGLNRSFHPTIDARFDTVAYYDVFALGDFATGLHFEHDTLVLEETSFHWAGSELSFGARLGLNSGAETPFRLDAEADDLDLNRLRPSLDYFGLQLPEELDSLPSDLSIRFDHLGILDDEVGILPGYNAGRLLFDDGRNDLFVGDLSYRPGPNGLETQLNLSGDPQIVNVLFGAENYFFSTGSFSIDLATVGNPANLRQLLQSGELHLHIDSTRVTYRAADVFVPVEQFVVDVKNERADYRMQLLTEPTRRRVDISGTLDRLSDFLFPERADRRFRVRTDISATTLSWSDLTNILQRQEAIEATVELPVDTTTSTRELLSATGGILGSFRPDLSLRIDTFLVDDLTPITEVHAGLHMRDTTQLVLERSGFRLGEGEVALSATYRLDERAFSPFRTQLKIEALDLEQLVAELRGLELQLPDAIGDVTGTLSLGGELTGKMDERNERILYDSLNGQLSYVLREFGLFNWPPLIELGRKAKMREGRMASMKFAPLAGELTVRGGRLELPRTEIQTTSLQLFVEGSYHPARGPDLLVSLPLRNVGRGILSEPPPPTGYALSGWKVYLVAGQSEAGEVETKFRLGRRRYFREHGRLEELRELRKRWRRERRASRRARR